MTRQLIGWMAMAVTIALCGPGAAQTGGPAGAEAGPVAPQDRESLKVYFASGSTRVDGAQQATLDRAERLYRDGSPIVMIVSGGADTVGAPGRNLGLSIARAQAVVDGLVARGIPADRLQLLGRGNSDLPVETADGVSERENRIAEITWR